VSRKCGSAPRDSFLAQSDIAETKEPYRMRRALLPVLVLATLAGCNGEPDPGFQKSVDDRNAAESGDPYLPLSDTPRYALYSYSRAEADQRSASAGSSAASLSGAVKSLRDKFPADTKLGKPGPLDAKCLPAIDAALAFYAGSSNAKPPATEGAERYSALAECREAAIAAEQKGEQPERANVLRRFASASMTLTGMTVAAKGDAENGVKIWREGDTLLAKDRPGYKFSVKSLRGW
jgi:hypothetical protein